MRPTTITVGPLVTASATNICTTQTPNAGTGLVLNGTLASNSFQGTGSIAGNVLTISAATSGVVQLRMPISGSQVVPVKVIGLGPNTTNGIGTYVLSGSQATVSSTTIYGSAVVTLDTPRRILLTPSGNESANTFTITGTGWNGDPITEALAGGNGVATNTNLDFATITQIVATNTAAGSLTVGTTTIASSRWMRFDDYAPAFNAIQATVVGTVNYTVEFNLQSETTVTNISALTWLASGISGATTSALAPFAYTPMRARLTLNSGSGSVSGTSIQNSNAPY